MDAMDLMDVSDSTTCVAENFRTTEVTQLCHSVRCGERSNTKLGRTTTLRDSG